MDNKLCGEMVLRDIIRKAIVYNSSNLGVISLFRKPTLTKVRDIKNEDNATYATIEFFFEGYPASENEAQYFAVLVKLAACAMGVQDKINCEIILSTPCGDYYHGKSDNDNYMVGINFVT